MTQPPPGEPDQPPSPYEPPSYGQPPHHDPYGQQPQWGQQPPYAPQPPYGQYGPPPGGGGGGGGGGTNVMAVLSLVFAFVFAPAGIVLGHLAKRQIRQTGEEGAQLATWGLVLSYVFTAIGLLACCGWIAIAIWANSDSGTSY
ncbi:DUF4190 domain-containing protein [Micromonospora sp. 4G57]|uniref:DUF4190 domain-containing protein n=1 Tax=Micromonospora sicca TaxID=2202420 RepID=A0ABU5J9T6_9ACTN|nr:MULTISPECIES: DUF4190 domain-containing protein [unclassified Micromonospora]MDZ5441805.1 DUF4190 domain-containing protein [Micromonospora sp. 4G57]MDZ5489343.1 DUF4190 domain-containing protein [Micromonospora sp. 4G53]